MKEYRVIRMFSKELNREVRVTVMLPDTYDKSERSYPVLYMHDGQNLFDPLTSYGGVSWGVLEAYENNPDLPEVIIVGVDNGGDERSNELVPYPFKFSEVGSPEYGEDEYGGNTDIYLNFIVEQIKPYIDKQFRTFKSPKNTALMGSSFGGVCSMYAAMVFGDYFGRFGCVSNAFYVIQEKLEETLKMTDFSHVKKMYMDVGSKESSNAIDSKNYVDSNQAIYDILSNKMDRSRLAFEICEDAKHHERDWAKRFPSIIKFLFND